MNDALNDMDIVEQVLKQSRSRTRPTGRSFTVRNQISRREMKILHAAERKRRISLLKGKGRSALRMIGAK